MNKRIKKKKFRKWQKYVNENFDIEDKYGNYKSISIRCHDCSYFESGDSSVGLPDSCEAPVLYDSNGDYLEEKSYIIEPFMLNLGYGCSYFRKIKN